MLPWLHFDDVNIEFNIKQKVILNKWDITPKDLISIIANLGQCNFDYLGYSTDNTKDEVESEIGNKVFHGAHNILVGIIVPDGGT